MLNYSVSHEITGRPWTELRMCKNLLSDFDLIWKSCPSIFYIFVFTCLLYLTDPIIQFNEFCCTLSSDLCRWARGTSRRTDSDHVHHSLLKLCHKHRNFTPFLYTICSKLLTLWKHAVSTSVGVINWLHISLFRI